MVGKIANHTNDNTSGGKVGKEKREVKGRGEMGVGRQ